jgi:uncharacterized membrane protein
MSRRSDPVSDPLPHSLVFELTKVADHPAAVSAVAHFISRTTATLSSAWISYDVAPGSSGSPRLFCAVGLKDANDYIGLGTEIESRLDGLGFLARYQYTGSNPDGAGAVPDVSVLPVNQPEVSVNQPEAPAQGLPEGPERLVQQIERAMQSGRPGTLVEMGVNARALEQIAAKAETRLRLKSLLREQNSPALRDLLAGALFDACQTKRTGMRKPEGKLRGRASFLREACIGVFIAAIVAPLSVPVSPWAMLSVALFAALGYAMGLYEERRAREAIGAIQDEISRCEELRRVILEPL